MARQEEDSEVRWPATIEGAVENILSSMSEEDRKIVESTPEEALDQFHHGWGTGIRNSFGLWSGRNRELLSACGCWDPDTASSVIIKAVWNRLRGNPINFHLHPITQSYTCPRCGQEAVTRAWELAELTALTQSPCEACRYEISPERMRQKEETARNNAIAAAQFEKARTLGIMFHSAYRAAMSDRSPAYDRDTPLDDGLLLELARMQYTNDPDFRSLWDDVKEEPPGQAHLRWLCLWRKL
jgi:DNA-directed RNA polymerase subunit RPC12/RpoP